MICDPSGKFLVSGDKGGEVIIWDIVTAKILKKIDIDSHELDPFSEADERFLEYVNQEIVKLF